MEVVPELRSQLPLVAEPWRATKQHVTLGQLRLAINQLLLDEYSKTGYFFNVSGKVEDEENGQRPEMLLKKAA